MKRSTVVSVLACAALAAIPSAADARLRGFQLPSGQIHCAYLKGSGYPTTMRCDARFLTDGAAVLKVRGRARFIHITDTIANPSYPVLHYGKHRRFGKFRCSSSRKKGVRCKSLKSGHGFFIARHRQGVF